MPEENIPDKNNKKRLEQHDTGDSEHMYVKVYSPYNTYFDGIAKSISAENDTGPFDILPRHHKFMTLLNPGTLTVRNDEKVEDLQINRGIMHVKEDRVTVFLDV